MLTIGLWIHRVKGYTGLKEDTRELEEDTVLEGRCG